MIGGITFASSQIASIYNTGSQQLADTLTRIASGKKFQSAAEDFTGFIHSQNLGIDISGYEQVRIDLTEFKTYTTAAVQAASSVYEAMTEMKDLAEKYDGASADLQDEYEAEFNALKEEVTQILANTYVDGDLVTVDETVNDSIKEINLDPDGNATLTLKFTEIADVGALDIVTLSTDITDLDTEIDNMLTYMSEAKAFDAIADQQFNFNDTIISSKQSVMSLITEIDEAEEMSKAVEQSIRQQAAISMLSQANMTQMGVMKLYM